MYKQNTAIQTKNFADKNRSMKNFIYAIAVAILALSTNVNAQTVTVNTGTAINLADSAGTDATVLKNTKAFVHRVGSKKAYGADVNITLAVGDTVTVTEVAGVKSRSGKEETQWMVSVVSSKGKTTEYLVSGENPTDAINDKAKCLTTASGCGVSGSAKVSAKHGDGPDGAISDLE